MFMRDLILLFQLWDKFLKFKALNKNCLYSYTSSIFLTNFDLYSILFDYQYSKVNGEVNYQGASSCIGAYDIFIFTSRSRAINLLGM